MNRTDIIKVDKILKTAEVKNGQIVKFLDMKEIPKPNKYELVVGDLVINMKQSLSKNDYDSIVKRIIYYFDELIFDKTEEKEFIVDTSDLTDTFNVRKLIHTILMVSNMIAMNNRFGLANVMFLNSEIAEILKDKIPATEYIIVDSLIDRIYLYRRNHTLDSPNLLFCYDEENDLCDIVEVGDVKKQIDVIYFK